MGVNLIGKLENCEDCILAKIKQKNVRKQGINKAKTAGERLLIDISLIKGESFGKSKHWLLIEDQFTNMRWSFFLNKRTEMSEKVINLIKELKGSQKTVKFIRMDNAGENTKLSERIKKEELNINIEFTSPNTPQFNGQVERSFATLWGRVRAMLNGAGFEEDVREGLWAECAATATKLSNLSTKDNEKCPYEKFYGKKPNYIKNLKEFGEMCVKAERRKNLQAKLENKGDLYFFLGYPEEHSSDTFRIMKVKTKTICFSRDVKWLGKTYGEYFGTKINKNTEDTQFESSDDKEIELTRIKKSKVKKLEGNKDLEKMRMILRVKLSLKTNMNPIQTIPVKKVQF